MWLRCVPQTLAKQTGSHPGMQAVADCLCYRAANELGEALKRFVEKDEKTSIAETFAATLTATQKAAMVELKADDIAEDAELNDAQLAQQTVDALQMHVIETVSKAGKQLQEQANSKYASLKTAKGAAAAALTQDQEQGDRGDGTDGGAMDEDEDHDDNDDESDDDAPGPSARKGRTSTAARGRGQGRGRSAGRGAGRGSSAARGASAAKATKGAKASAAKPASLLGYLTPSQAPTQRCGTNAIDLLQATPVT
jgi:hypothetical protein